MCFVEDGIRRNEYGMVCKRYDYGYGLQEGNDSLAVLCFCLRC